VWEAGKARLSRRAHHREIAADHFIPTLLGFARPAADVIMDWNERAVAYMIWGPRSTAGRTDRGDDQRHSVGPNPPLDRPA
jgi:hypothetical protein